MAHNPWNISPGLNHVGAYQVSGRPFAQGEINASAGNGTTVTFPEVTQWVQIYNYDADNDCKVGFSELGLLGTAYTFPNGVTFTGKNYFKVPASGANGPGISPVMHIKISELHLKDADDVYIVAGLTNILAARCSGSSGPSWSGSLGVG